MVLGVTRRIIQLGKCRPLESHHVNHKSGHARLPDHAGFRVPNAPCTFAFSGLWYPHANAHLMNPFPHSPLTPPTKDAYSTLVCLPPPEVHPRLMS